MLSRRTIVDFIADIAVVVLAMNTRLAPFSTFLWVVFQKKQ
jgi:hypothetical protein